MLLQSQDPIVGSIINTPAFHGWWAILWFLTLAVGIFFCAKKMSDFVEEISLRVRVSRAFLGGVVLSSVTSVPETIAGIFGGINNEVTFPIYNELGSNSISAVTISIALIATFAHAGWHNKRHPNKKIAMKGLADMGKSNAILFRLVCGLAILLVLFVNVPQIAQYVYIPGIRMSVMSFLPIGCFVWFAIWSFMHKDEGKLAKRTDVLSETRYKRWRISRVWCMFALVSTILVVLAYLNANVVESFSDADVLNMPESSAAGILLALSDGLPELTSVVFLMWKGHTAIAVGAVAGSHLYNMSQIFFTDAISVADPKGSFAQMNQYIADYNAGLVTEETTAAHQLIGIGPMFIAIALLMAMQTFKRVAKNEPATLSISGAVIGSYGLGFGLSASLL